MLNKKNIILSIIIICIIVAAVYCISIRTYSFHGNKIEKITIGNNFFYSEVVSNTDKMHKGLGGRNSLCQSCAMLFQFTKPEKYTFWMKDMRFPLDIIWISDGKVVYLEKNVSENFPGIMIPSTDADQVLEINAGNADKFDIKIGDMIGR
jgi:uncharacterized protein